MDEVKMILAIGRDGAIGKDGGLIWKIPEDLKRFKALTMGHPVIMGRKTWESLPRKPLSGRRNIVLTRQKDYKAEGGETVNKVEEAIARTKGEIIYIIGGGEIYSAFLPQATELLLTVVEDTCPEADSFLHLQLDEDWEIKEKTSEAETPEGLKYRYITYRRKL